MSLRLLAATLVCGLVSSAVAMQVDPTPQDREPGQTRGRLTVGDVQSTTIPAGEPHRWSVEMPPGVYYVEIQIDQVDIDLKTEVLRPDGSLEILVDGPERGVETVYWVAEVPGVWTVQVEAFETSAGGRYQATLISQGPATTPHRDRYRAALPDHANRLDQAGREASRSASYAAAERYYRRALAIREATVGPAHPDTGGSHNDLGLLYRTQARYAEAEAAYRRAMAIWEAALGPEHEDVATAMNNLAAVYRAQGRFAEAEPLYERALAISETALGPDHPDVGTSLNNLAEFYRGQGRYSEARPLHQRALAIREAAFGPTGFDVGVSLNNLGLLNWQQGRHTVAEPLLARAHAVLEAELGAGHPVIGTVLNNRAELLREAGRYAEAEPLYERSLAISQKALGPDHPDVGGALNNLALLYRAQGRYELAAAHLSRALTIWEAALGPNHPSVAAAVGNLASVTSEQGRRSEAAPLYERARMIVEAAFGPEHPEAARALNNTAEFHRRGGDLAAAGPMYERSLAIYRRALGPDHPTVAAVLNNLASLHEQAGRLAEALTAVDQALAILTRTVADPGLAISAFQLRAMLRRQTGDPEGGVRDLAEAIARAESQRPELGGGESERAAAFRRHAEAFDLMVEWRVEAGDIASAFEHAERGRARVLLDQLAAGKVDLRAAILPSRRAELEERESDARARAAEFRQRLARARSASQLDPSERRRQVASFSDGLQRAETDFADAYGDIKNASPLWRDLLTSGGQPVSLSEARRRLVPDRGLLLMYQLSDRAAYVLVVPPAGEGEPRAVPLEVGGADARVLGLEAGALTAEKVARLFDAPEAGLRGIFGYGRARSGLAVPAPAATAERLHAVWRMLVPEPVWAAVRQAAEVIVLPDGALHYLPFEALVVARGEGPIRHWLDDGPPIRYAPSATVLYQIERRPAPREGLGVLSLSDPIYDPAELPAPTAAVPSAERTGTASPSSLTRASYEEFGRPLERLPGTAVETDALRTLFSRDRSLGGLRVLQGADATESALRATLADHRYLHLATHGLVAERRADLFSALALTPPVGASPASGDDGFLQLHEIYGLALGNVQLAVLSACESNVGSRVEGEGVFALSRGFLAAGARRVVASQWAVNDASTAVLIGAFFEAIVADERAGRRVDYAAALREAKRRVRTHPDHPEWASPYYWAPFVLVGMQ